MDLYVTRGTVINLPSTINTHLGSIGICICCHTNGVHSAEDSSRVVQRIYNI